MGTRGGPVVGRRAGAQSHERGEQRDAVVLADRQGSITDMVDNNGTERLHRVFDSFGNVLSETHRDASGSIVTSGSGYLDEAFEYTGRWLDRDTGLQNNLNRWYDPRTGRFLSEDPIGLAAGDANLYRYVGNSPTNGTDPTGLWHWYSPCSWFWGDDPPANTRPSPGEHHTRAGDFPRTIGGPGHLGGIPGGTASQNYGIACRETGGLLRRTARDTVIAVGAEGFGAIIGEGGVAGRGLGDVLEDPAARDAFFGHRFPANRPYSPCDAKKIWDKLKQMGKNPYIDLGHPGRKWTVPHIHVPGENIHIPIDPGFTP